MIDSVIRRCVISPVESSDHTHTFGLEATRRLPGRLVTSSALLASATVRRLHASTSLTTGGRTGLAAVKRGTDVQERSNPEIVIEMILRWALMISRVSEAKVVARI